MPAVVGRSRALALTPRCRCGRAGRSSDFPLCFAEDTRLPECVRRRGGRNTNRFLAVRWAYGSPLK